MGRRDASGTPENVKKSILDLSISSTLMISIKSMHLFLKLILLVSYLFVSLVRSVQERRDSINLFLNSVGSFFSSVKFSGIYSTTAGLDPNGFEPSGFPKGLPCELTFYALFTVAVIPPPNGFKGLKSLYFEKLDVLIGKLPLPDGALGASGLPD